MFWRICYHTLYAMILVRRCKCRVWRRLSHGPSIGAKKQSCRFEELRAEARCLKWCQASRREWRRSPWGRTIAWTIEKKINFFDLINCKIGFLEVICVKSVMRRMRACRVREWREANEQCGWEWHVRVCCVQSCDSVELCNLEFFIEIFERQTCQKENFNGFTCAKMNEDWIILNFSKIILLYFLICLFVVPSPYW